MILSLIYRKEEMEEESPWDVLHNLQCDLHNLLQETDSKGHQPQVPKHALDMILKRTVSEIERAKQKIQMVFIRGEDDGE